MLYKLVDFIGWLAMVATPCALAVMVTAVLLGKDALSLYAAYCAVGAMVTLLACSIYLIVNWGRRP